MDQETIKRKIYSKVLDLLDKVRGDRDLTPEEVNMMFEVKAAIYSLELNSSIYNDN